MSPHGIRLRRSADRVDAVSAFTDARTSTGGDRVGLEGVLADLNRSATAVRVPAPAARWGFRWDEEDHRSARWWPQGITTSADRDATEVYEGRQVVLTSWYSTELHGLHKGSRITVVDLGADGRVRYRHVLLVDVALRDDGTLQVRPLKVHAGGIVWHGDHLHVAGTARGISVCRLDDIVRVGTVGDPSVLDAHDGSFGYRYVLPVRFTFDAVTDDAVERLRYSFLSLDRSTDRPRLVAGEYGRKGSTTRLVDYAVDPSSLLLRLTEDGTADPASVSREGVQGMQGATVVDGRWYVTVSAGRYRRGSLYVGRPGAFVRHARVLPVGVEDLTYWPSRDELWSLSEYPGRRWVFAMDRARFG